PVGRPPPYHRRRADPSNAGRPRRWRPAGGPVPTAAGAPAARGPDAAADPRRVRRPGPPRRRAWSAPPERRPRPSILDAPVATAVRRALDDKERGLAGDLGPDGGVTLEPAAFDHLISLAGGDARAAMNVLEGAVALAEAEGTRDAAGHVSPTLDDVEQAAQQRVLAYDRAGDGHYDTVSAFIKSLRGNDPDGALYWLASVIPAGGDPRFSG